MMNMESRIGRRNEKEIVGFDMAVRWKVGKRC